MTDPKEQPEVQEVSEKLEEMVIGEDGKPISKKALKKLQKEKEKEAKKKAVADRLAAEKAARDNAEDFSKGMYGKLPLNQSQDRPNVKRTKIAALNLSKLDSTVVITARIQTSRMPSSKMCFFNFRQRFDTVQGILTFEDNKVSKQMIKWAGSLPAESLVSIEAVVVKPVELVKACTVQEVELKIVKIHSISETEERLPFSIEDATRGEEEIEKGEKEGLQYNRVNLDTRLNNRIIDLRTITNQAIFRLQHAVSKLFREFLEVRDFTEIHSPKIIGAASEGGANVFRVSYFKNDAFLAQSPQLYKQMCICSDFERVFEIAPVFRAENSFTHRHMTEFMGLDIEMAFEEHYHEVLDVFDDMFVYIFKGLEERYAKEIEVVRRQYPSEKFMYLPKCLRLNFPDAVKLLRENGIEIGDHDDLTTEVERKLGALVRAKYNTDFFMLDKFPLAVRPFYTMPDPARPGYSNSYDFFIRGQEILSGAQRIHDPTMLMNRALEHGVDVKTIQPYVDAFKYGAPPHGGGGIGLERVVMLYLNLPNIRQTSLFPRDPKRLEP